MGTYHGHCQIGHERLEFTDGDEHGRHMVEAHGSRPLRVGGPAREYGTGLLILPGGEVLKVSRRREPTFTPVKPWTMPKGKPPKIKPSGSDEYYVWDHEELADGWHPGFTTEEDL